MPQSDLTALLVAWGHGDADARDDLMAAVYPDLRRRAGAYLRRERRAHTLQPTALVNEAYLRLVDQRQATWQNRAQFFGIAAQMMRRILVDHARGRNMAKRPGQWARLTFDERFEGWTEDNVDILDLDRALERLAAFDPRKSRIAEMRFFAGLSLKETGEALGISVATVEREWQAGRAWLFAALKGTEADA